MAKAYKLYKQNRFEQALLEIQRSINYDKTDGSAYMIRGLILYRTKRYEQAMAAFKRSLKLRPQKSTYLWMHYTAKMLNQKKEAELYLRYSKKLPDAPKRLPVVKLHEPYHSRALEALNSYQKLIGNKPTRIDMKLNNAAKKHAEYIALNHQGWVATNWHYQEKGKKGYFGRTPEEQAAAFGYFSDKEFELDNSIQGFTKRRRIATGQYLFDYLAATAMHRHIIISPGLESVGFHTLKKQNEHLFVFFYSYKTKPTTPAIISYPMANQRNVPLKARAETPDAFAGDKQVGYPITVQHFTTDRDGKPILKKAWLKHKGKEVAIYRLSMKSKNLVVAALMSSLKLVSIAAKDPLLPNSEYEVYMQVADQKGKIIFDKQWKFRTK